MSSLADTIRRMQGRDPQQEDEVAANADKASKQYEAQYGAAPEEEGVHEDSYTPGGILDPEAMVVGGALGAAGRVGRLALMADEGAPAAASAARGLARSAESGAATATETAAQRGARLDALSNPDKLQQLSKDPAAAAAAYSQGQKEARAGAQEVSDLRNGTAYRANTAKPATEPLDWQAPSLKQPPNVDARSAGNSELQYWKPEAAESTASGGASMSYPSQAPQQSVKDLQDQLAQMGPKDYAKAKAIQQQIRDLRQNPTYNNGKNQGSK